MLVVSEWRQKPVKRTPCARNKIMGGSVSSASQAYCERDGANFNLLGEPMNVSSNVVQIGLGIWFCLKTTKQKNRDVDLPGGFLFTAVAVGSAVWHSLGYGWALYLDLMIPFLFIAWFGFNWGFRQLAIRSVPLRCAFIAVALSCTGALSAVYTSPSVGVHLSWFSVLLFMGFVNVRVSTYKKYNILYSAAFYAVGLMFYAFDRELCEDEKPGYNPGFHWVWHLFSCGGGWVLLHSLPPEDHFVDGHNITPFGCCRRAAVAPERRSLEERAVCSLERATGVDLNGDGELSEMEAGGVVGSGPEEGLDAVDGEATETTPALK
jgi:hypothetical protein